MEEMLEALHQRKAQIDELQLDQKKELEAYLGAKFELPIVVSSFGVTVTYGGEDHSFYRWASDNELSSACAVNAEDLSDEEMLAYLRGRQARVSLFKEIRDILKELL